MKNKNIDKNVLQNRITRLTQNGILENKPMVKTGLAQKILTTLS